YPLRQLYDFVLVVGKEGSQGGDGASPVDAREVVDGLGRYLGEVVSGRDRRELKFFSQPLRDQSHEVPEDGGLEVLTKALCGELVGGERYQDHPRPAAEPRKGLY